MSVLCARATATRTAFDLSAPQPAEARSLLTSASTCDSALVRPVALGGTLGAGLGVGFGAVLGAGRRVVRVGVGDAWTVRWVARGVVACGREVGGRDVVAVEGRLGLGARNPAGAGAGLPGGGRGGGVRRSVGGRPRGAPPPPPPPPGQPAPGA